MQNTLAAHKLPPLILHPFADQSGPSKVVESSRASLMLQGLLPSGQQTAEDLERTLLDGRYQEIRMLFYVGKDILRWVGQCMEHVNRYPELQGSSFQPQSFAAYLVQNPPAEVAGKLKKWGVSNHKSIFSRALGLNVLLADMPPQEMFSPTFCATTIATPTRCSTATWARRPSPIRNRWDSISRFSLRVNIRGCSNANGRSRLRSNQSVTLLPRS